MKPKRCYTIWFAQRTGSTLLYKALESTGVAGVPREWMNDLDPKVINIQQIQRIWGEGTTPNGVFGMKCSLNQVWIEILQKELQLPQGLSRPRIWESAFPECKHIYMTRRNKVRLAVSWWRAIVSGEWHRVHGEKPQQEDIIDNYNFNAINHLLVECNFREAAMEDFFSEEDIVPLTIVYEDFVQKYETTVRQVLDYLSIPAEEVDVAPPFFDQIADDVAESWVQRFRKERQAGWENLGW
ncbi:hypothetical protein GCM10008018_21810 [Paenibacillus marchantiophytorum]|uniref:Sulphotransferase Stf0 domain-containing protein n=1 Tax=Paenibacillus marchantiophytorum TaxID=1619310 RepID=A0ABQ1EKF2_9BACL|nr:Stf0 family sulfotransferase [Paenibacillus marchantiophytorum]GFZ76023.1 hypothetical protein GCM10008018_21810 [Paenibacillus marchantiophytorum]